ncbi:hypothetical protein BD311DRAFT_746916, partial [Dichomitus squalens]
SYRTHNILHGMLPMQIPAVCGCFQQWTRVGQCPRCGIAGARPGFSVAHHVPHVTLSLLLQGA